MPDIQIYRQYDNTILGVEPCDACGMKEPLMGLLQIGRFWISICEDCLDALERKLEECPLNERKAKQ